MTLFWSARANTLSGRTSRRPVRTMLCSSILARRLGENQRLLGHVTGVSLLVDTRVNGLEYHK